MYYFFLLQSPIFFVIFITDDKGVFFLKSLKGDVMSIDIAAFDFGRRSQTRLECPGVSINTKGSAVFNSQATELIRDMGHEYCRVGVNGSMVVFIFLDERGADCYKVSNVNRCQVMVYTGGRLKPHAAVPVEVEGDYFVAKFD